MSVKVVYFQLPIVLSAFLLFLLQPIMAKQILPWFGGSASVWNTCVFFFQLLLLLGYLYAHALVRFVPPRTQAYIHIGMLAICVVSLPVIASGYWKSGEVDPAMRILMMLATTVGLPYFLLSSTSPSCRPGTRAPRRRPTRCSPFLTRRRWVASSPIHFSSNLF